MTTTPPMYWTPPSRWGAGRILGVVFGVLLLLPGLGLLAGGGALVWADQTHRSGGFVFSDNDHFATEGYALTSERIDVVTGANWVPLSAALGTARAEVTAADPSTGIFVGIAPLAEGSAYLDGVQRGVITNLGTTGNEAVAVAGDAPSGPPGEQNFWVAQKSGPGTQRLDWTPTQGDWLFVVMNADASAGVAMDARIGATVPALAGLAWGLVGAGLVLVAIGALLLVLSIRRQRPGRGYSAGPYIQPSSIPPMTGPSWAPPPPVDRTTAADARTETPTSSAPPVPPPG
jgi:hypothetical protein